MADSTLRTMGDIIDALGGPSAVAKLTNSTLPAVSNWQQFGRFPAKTYVVMVNALKRRRKSAHASLWGMTEAQEAAE